MARKKKKRIRIGKEARRTARAVLGPPPAERIMPNKRGKPVKHKSTLGDFLAE